MWQQENRQHSQPKKKPEPEKERSDPLVGLFSGFFRLFSGFFATIRVCFFGKDGQWILPLLLLG
jgi:hypothetical protein